MSHSHTADLYHALYMLSASICLTPVGGVLCRKLYWQCRSIVVQLRYGAALFLI